MTPTEHLIAFVAMAVAIVAILVIGILVAADILHLGRPGRASRASAPPAHPDLRTAAPAGAREMELAANSAGHARADE
jgi:hypothetical protein